MSVGVSPSDFVMFIEGIGWLVGVLRKDTVNGFERLAMTYAIFKEMAGRIDQVIAERDEQLLLMNPCKWFLSFPPTKEAHT
jgi:hypothetical protein